MLCFDIDCDGCDYYFKTVGSADAAKALRFPMADIEDALQAAAALAFHAQWIVTRNVRDYRRSPVPAVSPAEFVKKCTKP